jgi:hypothetical protein
MIMTNGRTDSTDTRQALTSGQRASLEIVLDMIVPPSADGRMPGAAEVGVPAYLLAEAPDALPQLCQELEELERCAREQFARGFAELGGLERKSLIEAMRAREPSFMSRLAMETLACYYQHDRVLGGLGMEARPPYPKGYQVVQGDLSLLEPVRARGKIYREAP